MQLNYFPINIEFEKYQINTELYSDERLTELKKGDDYTAITNRVIEALNEAKKISGKNNTKSIV